MKRKMLSFLMMILVTAFAAVSWANSSACSFLKSRGQGGQKYKNCINAFAQVPRESHGALIYSLKYLERNLGQFQDLSCAMASGAQENNVPRSKFFGMSSNKKGQLTQSSKGATGFKNDCTFIVNDVNTTYKGRSASSNAYYINLCGGTSAGKGLKTVTKFYMNKGTGTLKSQGRGDKWAGFQDDANKHTTVVGAFVTGRTDPFIPYSERNRRNYAKSIPAQDRIKLALYGLQGSNVRTAGSKPIHTSPYNSSWGCPSVSKENAWILRDLEKRGPSLVMNYGRPSFHKLDKIDRCDNRPTTLRGKRQVLAAKPAAAPTPAVVAQAPVARPVSAPIALPQRRPMAPVPTASGGNNYDVEYMPTFFQHTFGGGFR